MTKNADILQHVGTNDSARDMDSIRQALGEDQISYFGFSYGSELGATWATLFPDTVRAAVLDGAADPTVGLIEGGLQQAKGFEDAVATYLADCSADDECAFHNDGDAEGAFDELMLALDEEPMPERARPARRHAGHGAAGGRRRDVRREPVEPAVRGARRAPRTATARACSGCGTCTTSATPTAPGRTRSRRSRRSAAWTRPSA